jgi:hypothetical protein
MITHLPGHLQFCFKHAPAEICIIIILAKISIIPRVVFLAEKIKVFLKNF